MFDKKAYMKKYRAEHRKQIREQQREYQKEYARKYRKEHPEKIKRPSLEYAREKQKKHRQKHREKCLEYRKKWYKNNGSKISKVQHVAQKLPMAKECELCPDDDKRIKNLERHHPDYNYPEVFVTVCPSCHKHADKTAIKETK